MRRRSSPTTVQHCPILATTVYYLLLSHFCPLVSTTGYFGTNLSCPLLSITVHYCPTLSTTGFFGTEPRPTLSDPSFPSLGTLSHSDFLIRFCHVLFETTLCTDGESEYHRIHGKSFVSKDLFLSFLFLFVKQSLSLAWGARYSPGIEPMTPLAPLAKSTNHSQG